MNYYYHLYNLNMIKLNYNILNIFIELKLGPSKNLKAENNNRTI